MKARQGFVSNSSSSSFIVLLSSKLEVTKGLLNSLRPSESEDSYNEVTTMLRQQLK